MNLTACINTGHRSSNERGVADRTNSIPRIDSEFIGLILVQSRHGEAQLHDVCEVGLYPSATGSFPPLDTVSCNLAATIVWGPLPGQTDGILGDLSDTNICRGLCNIYM